MYEFPVESNQTDGHYQQSSFWRFFPYQPRWGPEGYDTTFGFTVRQTITVTAIREA